MTLVFTELQIMRGVPSATSIGSTATVDETTTSINLLGGIGSVFKVMDEGSFSGWTPKMPALKNGGVWADSSLADGRTLVAGVDANVVETMRLFAVGATGQQLSAALRRFNQFAKDARDFWATEWQINPVYIKYWAGGALEAQYSLVYSIQVDPQFDTFADGQTAIITLTIEREPAWRGLPPGDNPMKWVFFKRGLEPSTVPGAPAAGMYNHQSINLLQAIGGAANYQNLAEKTIYMFDEIGTAFNNYIDITPDKLPGDAACKALISYTHALTNPPATPGISFLGVSRVTGRDLFPANNANTANTRARNTFNAGDGTLLGPPANLTATKVINATGVFSNGSIVNRYVLDLVYAAGVVNGNFMSWTRVINQYPGRYDAYLRLQCTAGTPTDITFALQWRYGAFNFNSQSTSAVLPNTLSFINLYMGTLDLSQFLNKQVGSNGLGLDSATQFEIILGTVKTAATVPTVRIWDLVLLPIHEESCLVSSASGAAIANNDSLLLDSTNYFTYGKPPTAGIAFQSSLNVPTELYGDVINLVPGRTNRLYFTPFMVMPAPTMTSSVRVDIVPQWYGVRDE